MDEYNAYVSELDLLYVRERGEALRAQLFPTPKQDGVRLLALPVGITYTPGNSTRYPLVFCPVRSIQQVDTDAVPSGAFDEAGNALPDSVLFIGAVGAFRFQEVVTLSFAEVPRFNLPDSRPADEAALTALLRAIAGVEILDRAVLKS